MLMLALAAVGVTGCSGEAEAPNPYAAEFAKARSEVTTEVARKILEDDVITAAEYRPVKDASIQCMRDQGLTVELNEVGGLTFENVGSTWDTSQEELDAWEVRMTTAMDECEGKFDIPVLESLYGSVTDNPDNKDLLQAVADCLVRGGHRDEGYDKADYIEEMSSYATSMNVADDGSTTETPGALAGQAPPSEMTACERDPEQ
ncbi:hypothetical protein DLJ96_11040 [Actinotalea fermentans ATCC 43279 = JCM 9966 = DSM 3133]|nr:hypothetical protein DLJ96_11040 [Actinotalea fermentans ATCC 43279 = JCM 9966 = DSM 3133]